MSLFIKFASLEGSISCILNSLCINLYVTFHKNDFFLRILFNAYSNDISKFCNITYATLVGQLDNVLKEIFPTENYKLYFPQE